VSGCIYFGPADFAESSILPPKQLITISEIYNPLRLALYSLQVQESLKATPARHINPSNYRDNSSSLASEQHSIQLSLSQRQENFRNGQPTSLALALHQQFHGPPSHPYLPLHFQSSLRGKHNKNGKN